MGMVIHARALTRSFGRTVVVNNLDLNVEEATVTGFLGPNGAGKTTTIRLLLGLLRPHSGTCEVLGYPPGHPQALAQLGAMVESPALYDHLTGYANVEITRLMKNVPRTETDRVLNLVGLMKDAKRAVRTYSLGMRQRLGIALALLGEPRLLILDEPNNGLDPIGIQEMRELIRRLPQQTGTSVFLSSHILAEVEQVASALVVIHHGKLRYQGAIEGLSSSGPEDLLVRVDDPVGAMKLLEEKEYPCRFDGEYIRIVSLKSEAPHVAACIVEGGLALWELTFERVSLEARFLSLLEDA